MAPAFRLRRKARRREGDQINWCGLVRTWRACSAVARALCLLKVFLCRVRAALDPAPAPVLGMAAAAAALGGGLLCAEAGGGASARTKATPIKAKSALRIVISPLFANDGGAKLSDPLYTLTVRYRRTNPRARLLTPAIELAYN